MMHFTAFKSAVNGWGVALANGKALLIEFYPNQWGRTQALFPSNSLNGALRATDLFPLIKIAREKVVASYPAGQRRFGMPSSDAREEYCINLALRLTRDNKAWLRALEDKARR